MNGISANKKSQLPVSIDAAGRVVLPKKLRDSLHFSPGEPLVAEQRGEEIVIRRQQQAPGLVKDEATGLLVYDSGLPPGSEDVVGLIERDRERRMSYLRGDVDEP
jgi:AbrB family looped-hinge helix DNA binding protein